MTQNKKIGLIIFALIASLIRPAAADRWTTLLPLENVRRIQIQYDSLGQTYYWFGTDNNDLFRYDGRQFELVNIPDNTPAGFVAAVTALAIDAKNAVLWVGTPRGLFRYQTNLKIWERYDFRSGLSANYIKALYLDEDGTLWYGTEGGGAGKRTREGWFRYTKAGHAEWNDSTKQWEFLSNQGPASDTVDCIAKDQYGNMYFGTSAGLCVLDKASATWSCLKEFLSPAFPWIQAIAIDRHNTKWLGTFANGVCQLDSLNRFVRSFTPANSDIVDFTVYAIWLDPYRDGDLKWFATDKGVSVLDSTNQRWKKFTNETSGLASNLVRDIAGDRDGNLWFALLQSRGVSKLNHNWSELKVDDGLPSNFVYQVAKDRFGRLWVGTDHTNLDILSGGQWSNLALPNEFCENAPAVTELLPEENAMWVASQCGIFKFGLTNDLTVQIRITTDSLPGFPDNDVRAIAVRNDTLWAGTFLAGLVRVVNANTAPELDTIFFPHRRITALAFNHQGQLWAGTETGLEIFDGQGFRQSGNELPFINAIASDPAGATWVGTDGGLYRFDGTKWTHFSTVDGLPENRISAIGVAPNGTLWCGTVNGAANYAGGRWTAYTTDDGLSDNFILDLAFGPENVVWFATYGGGVARYRQTKIGPETYLLETFDLVTEASVTFSYSGYDFNTPTINLRYQYALDDTTQWSFPSSVTSVKLLIAADGLHSFYVRAIDKDGNADETAAILRFYKVSPDSGRVVTIKFDDPKLKPILDSLWLYAPPAVLPLGSTIRVNPVDTIQVAKQNSHLHFTGIAFALTLQPENASLATTKRPLTLKIFYKDSVAQKVDQNKLVIYRKEGKWIPHGVVVDPERRVIATTITELDTFALFEITGAIEELTLADLSNLAAQPRILSRIHASTMSISFDLGKHAEVTAKIYNLAGRLVQVLRENEPMNPGHNEIEWNGSDYNGEHCPSGMYLICVQAHGRTATKPVMVVNR